MKNKLFESLMEEALTLAQLALRLGEAPIGAVLAKQNGQVIGWGWNELVAKRDRSAHAEIAAFRDAAGRYGPEETDLLLVSTLEPCVMCAGCAMLCGVSTIVFGMRAPADGGLQRIRPPASPESKVPSVCGGILPDRARSLFEHWNEVHVEQDSQKRYISQLLAISND